MFSKWAWGVNVGYIQTFKICLVKQRQCHWGGGLKERTKMAKSESRDKSDRPGTGAKCLDAAVWLFGANLETLATFHIRL